MSADPVTAREIADLLREIRAASHPTPADPATRARLLERKAELLARIAAQPDDAPHPTDPAADHTTSTSQPSGKDTECSTSCNPSTASPESRSPRR